jgi:heptosyltransferase-3
VKILLIKLKHIGDSLMLTATTRAIHEEYPDAEVTVLVRSGCEGILAGASSIQQVVTSVAPETANRALASHLNEFKMIHQLRRQRFDYIFELTRGDRGRWWALALRGKNKVTYEMSSGRVFWSRIFDKLIAAPSPFIHAARQDYALVKDFLALKQAEPASLEFLADRADHSFQMTDGCVLIHPATRWKRKQWPEPRWRELIGLLVGRGERVILSSGPDADEIELCERLCADYTPQQVLFTGGRLSWSQLAGALYRSRLFIGVDTAAMHLAAACGIPTVGLFLPWIAPMWHPWKVLHQCVYADGFPTQASAELNELATAVKAMESISVEQVLRAVDQVN